ncbi:uncharacterized protein FPOAC1_013594 [Fusarium poae]|uniref:uncharacterized protein n=1 Tax=Fusarium poae TaxID=36050 RepID=UPI001D03D071|nr:uncharacterized protein FPOAC1_013594 [Fusarium poae]KAG8664814.1 hypothetical protein FPOAC1_013594 [Fusarium poae]
MKEKFNEGLQPVNNVKDFVSIAMKSEPTAAIAWLGITTLIDLVANPLTEPGINRDGVRYVLERVEWYWELAQLLLDPGKVDGSIIRLQSLLRRNVIKLYKKLLLYQMQSVCLYNKHWAAVIVRDLFKGDDWQNKVDSIKKAEASLRDDVNQHNSEELKSRLRRIDNTLGRLRLDVKAVESAVQVQTQVLRQVHHDENDQKCLQDLRIVDPEAHKENIEKTIGGLLKDSYYWILDHDDFRRFRNDPESRLLWIKGDPGKGKTMLLCGIINHLKQETSQVLSFYFCQATQSELRSAVSVLRGLLWLLCDRQSQLTSFVRSKYDNQGSKLFEDGYAFESLKRIFLDMLKDPCLREAVFVVDALDECSDDSRKDLIDFILEASRHSSSKWVVSSRNLPSIEVQFQDSENIRDDVRNKLLLKANDTFLWVALVCKELARPEVKARNTIDKLDSIPGGLSELYQRMLEQAFMSEDGDICRKILATECITYRPISLDELRTLVADTKDFSDKELKEVIGECGSFLTLQEDIVYFVHQSAQDFLTDSAKSDIFPSGIQDQHYLIFRRSLDALMTLTRNIYNLEFSGDLCTEISCPKPDPLSHLRYSCLHWVDHLEVIKGNRNQSDDEAISRFIGKRFLYWLEALSLQGQMPQGVKAVQTLKEIITNTAAPGLDSLVEDARRYVLSHGGVIAIAPLQAYASALVFSPEYSRIRELFKKEEPDWMVLKPRMGADWNACLQTLEGHGDRVTSVVFSADGQRLASGSDDKTVKIWDAATGRVFDDYGASWLTDGRNREILAGTHDALLRQIEERADLRQVFVRLDPDGGVRLCPKAIAIYEAHVQEFLKRMLAPISVPSGPPLRSPELLSITYINTGARRRSVFLWEKMVMIYVRYSKSQEQTGEEKDNIRFLPPAVGNLLLTYLARPLFPGTAEESASQSSHFYCLLANRVQFLREQSSVIGQSTSIARATLCELLAIKILRNFHDDNPCLDGLLLLSKILVQGFDPFHGAPPEVEQYGRYPQWPIQKRGGHERKLTALELAIISESKTFASSSGCRRVIDAVYRGKIVYTPLSFVDILPNHYEYLPVSLYEPRKAPLLDHHRLAVPRTRYIIELVHYIILTFLYVCTMRYRDPENLTGNEVVFILYSAGWVLHELAAIIEHGWMIHSQTLWSFLDLSYTVIFMAYITVRAYELDVSSVQNGLAHNILCLAAPILLARLAFNILPDHIVFISLHAMMKEFLILTFLAIWCFTGFLLALQWLSPGDGSIPNDFTIIKWLLWIWFGLDGTGIEESVQFHVILGPALTITFAFLGNTLFLTILVSLLTNRFSTIVTSEDVEIQFRKTVLTFEGVKSDAIFTYPPPFNLFALLILLPIKQFLSPLEFYSIHVFLVRLVNAPLLFCVGFYERRRLWTFGPDAAKVSRMWKFTGFSPHGDIQAVFEVEAPAEVLREANELDGLSEMGFSDGDAVSRLSREREIRAPVVFNLSNAGT